MLVELGSEPVMHVMQGAFFTLSFFCKHSINELNPEASGDDVKWNVS